MVECALFHAVIVSCVQINQKIVARMLHKHDIAAELASNVCTAFNHCC